jgi:hypothetical protein
MITDLEKERILLKMKWEGGIIGLMNYGLPNKLYQLYKDDFDEVYKFIDKSKYNKKQKNKIYILDYHINKFLNLRTVYGVEYTDEELNSVDYIFD